MPLHWIDRHTEYALINIHNYVTSLHWIDRHTTYALTNIHTGLEIHFDIKYNTTGLD